MILWVKGLYKCEAKNKSRVEYELNFHRDLFGSEIHGDFDFRGGLYD
jgi:hypothetical protein